MLCRIGLSTHESWAIDFASAFGVYKEVCQGWDKGASIASEEILPLLSPHALGSPSTEQGEVYVKAHAQSPEGIDPKKPRLDVRSCKKSIQSLVPTYHCIAKAWNWHKDEFWPAEMPSSAIKDAIFMPRLLNDAKKKSRFMGLSKPLPRRKVDKMKRMPRRENMDVTLSVIIIALTWLGVAFTAMTGECVLGWGNCLTASTRR